MVFKNFRNSKLKFSLILCRNFERHLNLGKEFWIGSKHHQQSHCLKILQTLLIPFSFLLIPSTNYLRAQLEKGRWRHKQFKYNTSKHSCEVLSKNYLKLRTDNFPKILHRIFTCSKQCYFSDEQLFTVREVLVLYKVHESSIWSEMNNSWLKISWVFPSRQKKFLKFQ